MQPHMMHPHAMHHPFPILRPPHWHTLPPMGQQPFPGYMDPFVAWGLPPNQGYNWWDYSSSNKPVESKIARIAYGIAGMLVRDRMGEENANILSSLRLKFFDWCFDGELPSLFESLGVKIDVVKPSEASFLLMSSKLQPHQIIIINGLLQPQPKEVFATLQTFLEEGGRMMVFNSSPHILQNIFGRKIHPAPHSLTVRCKMDILSNKELFQAYEEPVELSLEIARYPMITNDSSVDILARATTFLNVEEPLACKFIQGAGMAYIYVSKLFSYQKDIEEILEKDIELPEEFKSKPQLVKKEVEIKKEEGEKFEPLFSGKRKRPTPPQFPKRTKKQKEIAKKIFLEQFTKYLEVRGASKETIASWSCVLNVGYHNAFKLARSSWASMEMFAKILLTETSIVKYNEQLWIQHQEDERRRMEEERQRLEEEERLRREEEDRLVEEKAREAVAEQMQQQQE